MNVPSEFGPVLDAAQRGDDDAIAVLYRALNPRLLRYLRARVGEPADDVAAEVWMAVARQLPSFVGDDTGFRAWVFGIARRQVAQHWRRTGRQRSEPVPGEVLDLQPDGRDPEASVDAEDAARTIVAHLTHEQAEVVLLRVVGGLDAEEVAALIGKRPGAVRVIQHRALRRLAARLASSAVTP